MKKNATESYNPGELALSLPKLKRLNPRLLGDEKLRCSAQCPKLHDPAELRAGYVEHLLRGDSTPALVLSVKPLVVGAYTPDIDAVTLLRFPDEFADEYGLKVGSRLLAVNTYSTFEDTRSGTRLYASDLVPGPARTNYSNVHPLIAEFYSDDLPRAEVVKARFTDFEWDYCKRLADIRVKAHGLQTARTGEPVSAGSPVKVASRELFFDPALEQKSQRGLWLLVAAMFASAAFIAWKSIPG